MSTQKGSREIFTLTKYSLAMVLSKLIRVNAFDKDNKCFLGKAVGMILHTDKECELLRNQHKLWPSSWTYLKLQILLKLQLFRNCVIHIVEKILTKKLDDT
ncbi:hypothetical protein AVEN_257857-1 [Araneus ventricosus]|uniref:Uncharacterized protein n=1 Tax=Araneus ventricosus TaxID=182803 RepID=A0A4Y2EI36_ARAVE|nr:hypothetical protein AVEN_257857-1 [Araneus ventricosus]